PGQPPDSRAPGRAARRQRPGSARAAGAPDPAPAQPAPEPGTDPDQRTARTCHGQHRGGTAGGGGPRGLHLGRRQPLLPVAQRRPLPDHPGPLAAAATDRRAAAEPGAGRRPPLRARPDPGRRRQRGSGTGCGRVQRLSRRYPAGVQRRPVPEPERLRTGQRAQSTLAPAGAGASFRTGPGRTRPGQPQCRGHPPLTCNRSNMEAPSATAITPPANTHGKKEFVPPGPVPEVLSKRYRIERLLGVGGMGAVYRARDLLREQFGDPEPWVAVKALNDTFAEYPDAHALLYSEFALTSRLRHAHVVQLYGFHTDARCRRAYITMELLKGPTLDDLISANPEGLPWEQFR